MRNTLLETFKINPFFLLMVKSLKISCVIEFRKNKKIKLFALYN